MTFSGYAAIDLDSLETVWNDVDRKPENRLKAGQFLILYKYSKSNIEACKTTAFQMLELAEESGNAHYKAEALRTLGIVEHFSNNSTSSLEYFNQALKTSQLNDEKKLESDILMNISTHYASINMYSVAMNYLMTAQAMKFEMGDTVGAGMLLNNIGTIHISLENFEKAFLCFQKALRISEKNNNKKIEHLCYMNMCEISRSNKKYSEAIVYCEKAIKLCLSAGDTIRYAIAVDELSQLYFLMDQYDYANEKAKLSIELYQKVGNSLQAVSPILTLGKVFIKEGSYQIAIDTLNNAMKMVSGSISLDMQAMVNFEIYNAYKLMGKNDSALVVYERYNSLNGLIAKEKESKDVLLKETQKKFLKQALNDSIYYAQQQMIKDEKLITQAEQLSREKTMRYGLVLLLLFVMALAFFLYKQRNIISNQKTEVDRAHRSIQDSIEYSQRIQQAVLPSDERLQTAFNEFFKIYLPKDIVSGDFYWIHIHNDEKLLAVGDCTGHGVPGAFMSIMSINILTQIIEEGFITPKDILIELDVRLNTRLRQNDQDVKDGIDLSLCLLNDKKITFSSTHVSLYRISDEQLYVYRGSSVYLGDGDTSRLESIEISCEKGDLLYFFTDGFADQNGGPESKRFYSKRVQEMVLKNHKLPLSQQSEVFEATFNNWKGGKEQVDDVTVFCLEI